MHYETVIWSSIFQTFEICTSRRDVRCDCFYLHFHSYRLHIHLQMCQRVSKGSKAKLCVRCKTVTKEKDARSMVSFSIFLSLQFSILFFLSHLYHGLGYICLFGAFPTRGVLLWKCVYFFSTELSLVDLLTLYLYNFRTNNPAVTRCVLDKAWSRSRTILCISDRVNSVKLGDLWRHYDFSWNKCLNMIRQVLIVWNGVRERICERG